MNEEILKVNTNELYNIIKNLKQLKNDTLQLVYHDNQLTIKQELYVQDSQHNAIFTQLINDYKVDNMQEFTYVINSKKFINVVKSLKDIHEYIIMYFDRINDIITITNVEKSMTIKIDIDKIRDNPQISNNDTEEIYQNICTINHTDLINMIKEMKFFCDTSRIKPIYNTMNFHILKDKLQVIACQGYYAARKTIPMQEKLINIEEKDAFNISLIALELMLKVFNLGKTPKEILISKNDNYTCFSFDNITMTIPIVEGKFIDDKGAFNLSEILPFQLNTTVQELSNLLNLFAYDNKVKNGGYTEIQYIDDNIVKLVNFDNEQTLKTCNELNYTLNPLQENVIAFNGLYLQKILSTIPKKFKNNIIVLGQEKHHAPINLYVEGYNKEMILLPMREMGKN